MSAPGSVTQWVGLLRAGNPAAARQLWDRYFGQLVALARRRLAGLPRGAADEEDVALSAFDSFCKGAREDGFANLETRNDLWRLLATLTIRRAIDLRRRSHARKRGRGEVAGEGPDALAGREPLPEVAAEIAEQVGRLLEKLGDVRLQELALWKLEGHTNEEIAGRLGCVPRTVERRLRVIRSLWSQEVADEPA